MTYNVFSGTLNPTQPSAAAAAGAVGLCRVLCCLALIVSRNTPFPPSSAGQSYTHCCTLTTWWLKHNQPPLPSPHRATDRRRPATVRPHWCHIASTMAYLGSLAYCATPGLWSRSLIAIT